MWIAYYALLERCAHTSTKSLIYSQAEEHASEMQKAKEEVRDATLDFETKSQALHDQISSLKDKINQKDAEIYSLNQEIAAH